jgi:putative thioredoxin
MDRGAPARGEADWNGDDMMLGQTGQAANGASDLIKDTTTAAFRVDVIAESARQPVLVDFWAPWCEPCKQMTPIIEKVIKAAGGKVKLVKMNIDEHPEIAGQLGVKSIPAVIAFQKGQPVDGFMGALPESQIKGFLERLVGPLGGEGEELAAEAEAALAAGDAQGAVELFSEALALDPADLQCFAGLVRALVALGDLEQARAVLDQAPAGADKSAAIAAARAALEVAEQAASVGDLGGLVARVEADPLDHAARIELAIGLNGRGDRREAADQLLEAIRRDRTWNEEAARKQLLQFFEAWGMADPETLGARRRLSGILFS